MNSMNPSFLKSQPGRWYEGDESNKIQHEESACHVPLLPDAMPEAHSIECKLAFNQGLELKPAEDFGVLLNHILFGAG